MKVLTAIISASFLFGMPALAEPFNGPVLGLSLGQSRGSVDFNFNGTVNGSPNKETGDIPMSLDGGEFGVYAGYRHAFDGGFVIGAELGYINGRAKSSSRISVRDLDFSIAVEKNSQFYFDFKPGFANGEGMMIYGLIGYQRTGFDGMYTDNDNDNDTGTAKVVKASTSSSDLRIGFGVEYALSENVTIRGQYHQSSFGDLGFDFVKPKTENDMMEDFIEKYDARESVVSIGITFGF